MYPLLNETSIKADVEKQLRLFLQLPGEQLAFRI
jgi:hypothetical protein